jgi:alpha-tubulin suppressor-like RCC1 family protein
VTKSGQLFLWGDNKLGTLGIKEQAGEEFLPGPVAVSFFKQRIESVSCGRSVTFALTPDGVLWGWGFGKHNVLLEGDSCDDGMIKVSSSRLCFSSLASLSDIAHPFLPSKKANTVKRQPSQLKLLQPLISVSSGINHAAAVTRTRELVTWGSSDCGKLGHPVPAEQADSGPVKIKIPGTVVQAACGATFTVVLSAR